MHTHHFCQGTAIAAGVLTIVSGIAKLLSRRLAGREKAYKL